MIENFYVVCVISNPVRYKSRYDLYNKFMKHMANSGAKVITVELAYGQRPFTVTHPNNDMNVQLRTSSELWHKENLINIGMSRLPANAEYIAWIDADIEFIRKDWMEETIHQLQHYQVVQMFQNAYDLGPTGEHVAQYNSFMYQYCSGKPYYFRNGKFYEVWHPGYAWAARRSTLDALGGLIDTSILGASDHHMAHGLIGKMDDSIHGELTSSYKKNLKIWEDRATNFVRKDVGFVPGTILHYWHGRKSQRFYSSRWKILIENSYDPYTDVKKDIQGVYTFNETSNRTIKLRDDIRKYFRSRNEDSIDLE